MECEQANPKLSLFCPWTQKYHKFDQMTKPKPVLDVSISILNVISGLEHRSALGAPSEANAHPQPSDPSRGFVGISHGLWEVCVLFSSVRPKIDDLVLQLVALSYNFSVNWQASRQVRPQSNRQVSPSVNHQVLSPITLRHISILFLFPSRLSIHQFAIKPYS